MPVETQEISDLRFLGGVFAEIQNGFMAADYTDQLREFTTILVEKHRQTFESQSSPSGEAWPPLAESTVRRKGHDTILVDTERLRNSLLEEGHGDHIQDIDSTGSGFTFLTWGTSVPYSIFHQDGTGRLPQREHVGITDTELQPLVDAVADATVESLKPQ